MTEEQWLVSGCTEELFAFLGNRISKRKMRLLACACCRRVLHLLTEEKYRAAIELAEAFADRLARKSDLFPLHRLDKAKRADRAAMLVAAKHASLGTLRLAVSEARWAALHQMYHTDFGDAHKAESSAQADLIREVFGNPFRMGQISQDVLARNDDTVGKLAQAIYNDRAFDRLPILADSLEESGCTNADILNHCRQPGEHVRGCWVVDELLGKS